MGTYGHSRTSLPNAYRSENQQVAQGLRHRLPKLTVRILVSPLHLWLRRLWLAARLEFDVPLGGELEDLRRGGDLWPREPQDRIRARRPPGWQGVAEASPVQVLAGRHPALPLADPFAECKVLGGKVTDPGGRLRELAVVFSAGVGGWFGGAQGLDRLAGMAAAQFGVGGDGQVPGASGSVFPFLPVGRPWPG